ncbi:hypothetical protein NDU88_004810 [Pleurodeles waltl]|uniref:Uncharacterized protein n=1 Tax=Pleurodeles waltl TaxID=8319 RepID=A0AAV7N436_PLEWA|nr:hypothetical protein NDU88_004810 [Pleurodeles waltl]
MLIRHKDGRGLAQYQDVGYLVELYRFEQRSYKPPDSGRTCRPAGGEKVIPANNIAVTGESVRAQDWRKPASDVLRLPEGPGTYRPTLSQAAIDLGGSRRRYSY